jgi:hypothetical protein
MVRFVHAMGLACASTLAVARTTRLELNEQVDRSSWVMP